MQMSISPYKIVGLSLILFFIVIFIVLLNYNISKKAYKNSGESSDNTKNKYIKKNIGIILLIIEGLPLIIYPFILLADIMSLAGEGGKTNIFLTICVVLFLLLSTTYPLTYILSFRYFLKKGTERFYIAFIPALHLVVTTGLFYLWGYIEKLFKV